MALARAATQFCSRFTPAVTPCFYALLISLVVLSASGVIFSLQAAEVIYTEGTVQVQPEAGTAWKKAAKGVKLNSGDSLRTARHSLADLVLDDEKKNTIRVEEQTLIVLGATSVGSFDRFDLKNGKVYANVESVRAGMSFEVSTPSAVVGVRGTGWSVTSDKKQDEVAVFKDKVFVRAFDAQKNLLSEVSIGEGFKAMVERFKTPGIPLPLNERELKQWDQVREQMSLHLEGKTTTVREVTEQIKDQEETLDKITETKEEILKESERKSEDVHKESMPEYQEK